MLRLKLFLLLLLLCPILCHATSAFDGITANFTGACVASKALALTTDEVATCRYDTSDVAYASLSNTFNGAGTTSHSATVTPTCGTANTYYIRCIDDQNNANSSSSTVVLTYDAAKSATLGAGSQTITIGAGTNTISW